MSGDFNITWSGLWRVFFMILLVWVLFVAHSVFIGLFLAIVIAAALDRPVTFLENKRIPRILGTLIIYIILMGVLGLLLYSVIPAVLSELSIALSNLQNRPINIASFIDTNTIIAQINANLGRFAELIFGGANSLLNLSSRFLGGVVFAASVFVFSFYLTVGRDGVEKLLITILPTAYEPRALELYKRVRHKIGRWLQGQLILSVLIGLAVFIGLKLLGVKYSLLLGILAGVMELIPYVGPIFSGGIAVLMGLTVSLKLALYTLILFIIIQQLENHILVPTVMSKTTALNPVVIIASILIGFKIFGFVGIILAVPAAVLIQELVEDWSNKKHNKQA
jgi:predicted PurR-regulated permease PerM